MLLSLLGNTETQEVTIVLLLCSEIHMLVCIIVILEMKLKLN